MENCLFCKIGKGEIPAEFVYQDDETLAFKDIHPSAPVHVLIVPKKHIESLNAATEEDKEVLAKIQFLASKLAKDLNIDKAFRLTVNTGEGAGQTVFHLHYHLQGGW